MIKDTNNLPKIIDNLQQFNRTDVRAGVLEGGKMQMIAHVQEYGATITAKNAGGYLMIPMPDGSFRKLKQVTIPARPFIQMTVINHQQEWKNEAAETFNRIIRGNSIGDFKVGLAKKMKLDIQNTMRSGNFTANAPLTVERKGGSQPLIDTGGLLNSIQGKVDA